MHNLYLVPRAIHPIATHMTLSSVFRKVPKGARGRKINQVYGRQAASGFDIYGRGGQKF